MRTKSVAALLAAFMATCIAGFASPASLDPQPKPVMARGTRAGMPGPNLVPDSSFESMDASSFTIESPFRAAADTHARSGKADVQVALSGSGKRIHSHLSIWTNTGYVSSLWVRGSGSGTLFVATHDLSQRLAAINVTAIAEWGQVSLAWNSGQQTNVALGFQDDVSTNGTIYLDDFCTGLQEGSTIAFVAPPAYDLKPQAPPGFSLIFDDEFTESSTIDVNNTQKDGYKWYVKGM